MGDNYIFDDLRIKRVYDISICSGQGRREAQQDTAYAASTDEDVFAVVCDGMGGLSGGRLASGTAVEAFTECYQVYSQNNLSDCGWMQQAAEAVDDIVYSLTDQDGRRLGAGTTLASVVIHKDCLHWVSIGDSRIYIFRGNELAQITNDHNYYLRLNQQKAEGRISQEKYREETRNGEALISFIGMGGLALIDINEEAFQLYSGDVILLCTDGVYRTVSDKEIKIILSESESTEEASNYLEELIAYRALSHQDNYTCILIKRM